MAAGAWLHSLVLRLLMVLVILAAHSYRLQAHWLTILI
jgi:hypothetical protein